MRMIYQHLVPMMLLILLLGCDNQKGASTNARTEGSERGQELHASELHAKGLRLYNEEKYEEAIKVWLEELNAATNKASAFNNIGLAYVQLGDYDTAIEYHLKAIEENPVYGHAHYSLGLAYYEISESEKATPLILKAIELGYRNANVYYSLGLVYRRANDFERASTAFKETISLNPSYPGAHYQLGLCYIGTGEFDLARRELAKEAELNPNWKYHVETASLMIDTKLEPTRADLFYELGMRLVNTKYWEDALDAFNRAASLDSAFPDVHYHLGLIYKERFSDHERARQEFQEELKNNPGSEKAREALGWTVAAIEDIQRRKAVREGAYMFATVVPCEVAITENLCISGETSADLYVTILGEKMICRARTGEQTEVYNQVESYGGTRLKDIECENPEVYVPALIVSKDAAVKDYEKLDFPKIDDSALIKALDDQIGQEGHFDISTAYFSDSQYPNVYRYPYPGREIHIIEYNTMPRPLFLANNGNIRVLVSGEAYYGSLCSRPVNAFRVNERYFVVVNTCVCETDGCGESFIEITPTDAINIPLVGLE